MKSVLGFMQDMAVMFIVTMILLIVVRASKLSHDCPPCAADAGVTVVTVAAPLPPGPCRDTVHREISTFNFQCPVGSRLAAVDHDGNAGYVYTTIKCLCDHEGLEP